MWLMYCGEIRIIINNESKSSLSRNGVGLGQNTISSGSGLSPDPAPADVIMVEISPKVVLSSFSIGPVPCFLDGDTGSVHIRDVVAVGEGGHLCISSECVLAHLGSDDVASDFQTTDGIGEGDDASSPPFVEGLVGVGVGGEGRIELIEGSIEFEGMDDAGDWKDLAARGVSFVGVASVAGHPPDIAVCLCWPHCGLEREPPLGCESLSVV